MASQQEILDINGVDVHVAVDGPENAPALTFAHALSLDLRSFGPQVAAFRDKYKVVRLDLRGHGKSDVGGYLQYMAQDVAGIFLDHMHKALGAEARYKNSRLAGQERDVIIDVGTVEAYNLRDLARSKGGRPKKVA